MRPWQQRAGALSKRAPKDATVAEIGFGNGNMARVLAETRPDIRLTMVDNFLTAEAQPYRYRSTGDDFARSTKEQAEGRCNAARQLAARVGWRFIRSDSVAAAYGLGDATLDLVFIDADHSEEGVRRDVTAWLPKVRPGGWIGGHDYRNAEPRFDFSGVDRAVDKAFGDRVETDANFTWWVKCAS